MSDYSTRFQEYIYALDWKRWKAKYHKQAFNNIWDSYNELGVRRFGDKKFWETLKESTAEVEAMILVLSSMGDIVAQIINVLILNNNFDTSSIYFDDKLIDRTKQIEGADKIINAINELKKSDAYKYIKAFSNTVKHVKSMPPDYNKKEVISFDGKKSFCKQDIKFEEFKYREKPKPETSLYIITESYSEKILSGYEKIIEEINVYVYISQ